MKYRGPNIDYDGQIHPDNEFDLGNSGTGTVTIDWAKGNCQKIILTGSCTFAAPPNLKPGATYTIRLIGDSTSIYAQTWNSVWVFGSYGIPIQTNRSENIVIDFYSDGTNCYALPWISKRQSYFTNVGMARETYIVEAGTNFRTLGLGATTLTGTGSAPAYASTNLHTSTNFLRLTSASSANSASEAFLARAVCWRGNAAGLGGFFWKFTWAVNTTVTNQRGFQGLHNGLATLGGSQVPSNLTEAVVVGWDSADTNLQVMHNDGSGTCTKVDLGASFPANNTTAVYRAWIWAEPNDSVIYYRVERLDTGTVITGTLTTNLPTSTVFLAPRNYMNNGGTASAVVLDIRAAENLVTT